MIFKENDMEKYLALLRQSGADLARVIDPKTVATAPWVAFKYQYGCPYYGKNLCCPPRTPAWRETQAMLDCFGTAILFRCHDITAASPLALEAVRRLFRDGYYKATALGSGPCLLCEACDPAGCRHPGQAVPSMEACGIDVFATARANGMAVETLADETQQQNCFGLVLVE